MTRTGRKSTAHEPPQSVDKSRAVFSLTIRAQDRTGAPLLAGGTADGLLEAVRLYHDTGRWRARLALVMPDHIHILASIPGDMSEAVSMWKQSTARQYGVLWLRGYLDLRLRGPADLREKAGHILQNPIRAGLVEREEDWHPVWLADGAEW